MWGIFKKEVFYLFVVDVKVLVFDFFYLDIFVWKFNIVFMFWCVKGWNDRVIRGGDNCIVGVIVI